MSRFHRAIHNGKLGFTLVELLVVIAVMLLLLALLLPSMQGVMERANQVICMSNMRQLTHGWIIYASENGGQIMDSNTYLPTEPYCWVDGGNTLSALQTGKMWPYCPNPRVYQCPSDPSGHLRSYSMNGYLNGEHIRGDTFTMLTHIATEYVMCEENDPRGWNINSFMCPNSGDCYVDVVANWHKGMNISFADGRVEFWRWVDPQSLGTLGIGACVLPPHPDLTRLQSVCKTW
jgi:prepilin-type N-terminal cleavage/methylation domain-containing protein/prepilin-type processing-associated H-X9-DG protein